MASVGLADVDGDGDLDACVDENLRSRVLLNDGTGLFSPGQDYSGEVFADGPALADLNGDGEFDLVSRSINPPIGLTIRRGNGVGGFGSEIPGIPLFFNALTAKFGDVDGNGLPDIVVGHGNGAASLILNDGAFAFRSPSLFVAADGTERLEIVDIDRDGDPDVVTPLMNSRGVGLVRNRRIRRPMGFCPADIDGDAYIDAGDFNILAAHFGASVEPDTLGDLNGDGVVNVEDFAIFAAGFGRSCP
jgi:hypothetical protein